jgi:hypothetical protein
VRVLALVAHVFAHVAHAVAVAARWIRAEWPPARHAIAAATAATVQAIAAAATGAAAGASRAWREAQQRRRPN